MKRFSKAMLAEDIQQQIDYIQSKYEFVPSWGYSQVEGKGEEANRAYGKYQTLIKMAQQYELMTVNFGGTLLGTYLSEADQRYNDLCEANLREAYQHQDA